MTEVLKNLTVDLSRKGGSRPIFAVENDTGGRKLKIKITDDGAPYKLDTGTVAALNYKRADKACGAILGEIEGDAVLVTLNSLILGSQGQVVCSVSLSDENKNKVTSSEFCFDVGEELYSGEAIDTAPEYGLLLDTLSRLSEIEKEEAARVVAEAEREAAREAFEGEVNEKLESQEVRLSAWHGEMKEAFQLQNAAIGRHDGDIATRFAQQDATIESRLAAQDAAIDNYDGEIEARFIEQDVAIDSRLSAQDVAIGEYDDSIKSKFAEQDAKLNSWYGQIKEAFQLQNAAIGRQDLALESRLAAQEERLAGRLGKGGSVTLKASAWSGENTQTVAAGDVSDDDMVIFYPATADDREYCGLYGVFLSPESVDGYFTASARAKPVSDISLKCYVIRGRLPEEVE